MEKFLRNVPLFADLPKDDLARLAESVEDIRLDGGQVLFEQGDAGKRAYVIREGELEILKEAEGREVLLAVRKPGEVIGEMSLLHEAPRSATVRAKGPARLFAIRFDDFENLLDTSPSAARAMLHTITARLKSTEKMLRQSEKIAQLGTLTAGVAHELNNPAAAVQRGAEQVKTALSEFQEANRDLAALDLSPAQLAQVQELGAEVRERAKKLSHMDALTRSDRETEMEEFLEGAGIERAWDLAPSFVSMGFEADEMAPLAETFSPGQFERIAHWVSATYAVYNLLEEVEQGAKQISQIVKALKTYAYLDQAPVQLIDVHEGLDNTLILLRSKLKKGITVKRSYSEDIPRIEAYGSELNQVWTNLLDNAIDALEGEGEIQIRTRKQGAWVVVEIEDNGPGIPEEIQGRIFDPFFTTKGPGKGTGLGLDISYNIVVQRHHGDVRLTSRPGRTCFEVWLPVDLKAVESGEVAVPGMEPMGDEEKLQVLRTAHTIAVVGISTREDRPAHYVPAYLQAHGYHIIPIHSSAPTVLGEEAVPSLEEVKEPVDVVLLFKRSQDVPPYVDQAIAIGAEVVWMQEGIVNEGAAAKARQAGLMVIMDSCMRIEHQRLIANATQETRPVVGASQD
jgi:signal transduction histidine kinase/predicted CoA-binding protein